MLDLEKIEEKIDSLFEKETSDSLTKWLFTKRFGKINILLGTGSFISMKGESSSIFSNKPSLNNFNSCSNSTFTDTPINRQAA